MNFLLGLPIEVRLAGLFALGALVASGLNLAIYRLAWHPRLISPWSPAPPKAGPRTWIDRIPIFGWWGLARESKFHGHRFWARPMLLEIGTGVLFAWLYSWTVEGLNTVPAWFAAPVPPGALVADDLVTAVHMQFVSQLILVALMIVASFIDIDEKIIPDAVTVPGTLAGLALAAAYPWSMPFGDAWLPPGAPPGAFPEVEFLTLVAPNRWPGVLAGWPEWRSLALAAGCWLLWCFALLPRLWTTRRGYSKAVAYFFARMFRDPITKRLGWLTVAGLIAIGLAWRLAGPAQWAGLLISLVGMAVAGSLVWIVRLIGFWALRREAMGFGDVTLMAMIGTFAGWQTSLVIFFLAPLAGMVIGLARWLVCRDREIPYGPFLCVAALVAVTRWAVIWQWCSGAFEPGWLVPAALGVCLLLMGLMLGVWGWIRMRLLHWE